MTGRGCEPPCHFENRQSEVGFDEDAVVAFLQRLAAEFGDSATFSVVVSQDSEVKAANRRFRAADRTTDVLSFPDGEDQYLGDILISARMAAAQADERGHTVEEEIETLALHGLLHLAGFDHETDDGRMRAKERVLRRRYGLPSGLIERADG